MNVVICESDLKHREFIKSIIFRYIVAYNPSIYLTLTTASAEEVLEYLERGDADCYFLGIDLGSNMNGIELAQLIRKRDPFSTIIFISEQANKLKLTLKYRLAVLDFILIDHEQNLNRIINQVEEALKVASDRYSQIGKRNDVNFLQIKMNERIINIKHEDILFFETSPRTHRILLHTRNNLYEFYGRMKNKENLNSYFYRCHKSYIINLQHVKFIDKHRRKVMMINGSECLVSTRKLKELQRRIYQVNTLVKV